MPDGSSRLSPLPASPTWPPYPPRKPLWTRRPGGPDWMPITPKTGSLFHADPHPSGQAEVFEAAGRRSFAPFAVRDHDRGLGRSESPIYCKGSSDTRFCLVHLVQRSDWVCPRGKRPAISDSLLEGDGFQPSVPREGSTRRDGLFDFPETGERLGCTTNTPRRKRQKCRRRV